MSEIEFNNISFSYDKKEKEKKYALNKVSFNIEKGDFVAVVGKTGSGKSTLIQTLNALLLPTSGYTKVNNFYVTGDKTLAKELIKEHNLDKKEMKRHSFIKKEVGIVFQFSEYQLFAESVIKDVMFGPKNFGMSEEEAKKEAIKALNLVGIDESYYERSPFELSGGEKRRVALAGIIASSPKVLVLDEPTVGLDPSGKKEILDLIDKIHEAGTTLIVVTHDMDLVFEHAKKVVVLHDAKLVKISTPSELFSEDDLKIYSLEAPTLFKFKNLLKKYGFKKDLSHVDTIEELAKAIGENR